MKLVLGLLIIIGLLITPIMNNSFATEKPELEYKIAFMTNWENCSDRNKHAFNFYNTITKQYIEKYGYKPISKNSICTNNTEIMNVMKNTPDNVLLIIITDYINSAVYKTKTAQLGHVTYNDNIIVSTASGLKIEHRESAWTLSHELSHYILWKKGYDSSIFVDYVHALQSEYWNCKNKNPSCKSIIVTPIISEYSGNGFATMKIYQEPEPIKIEPIKIVPKITKSKVQICYENNRVWDDSTNNCISKEYDNYKRELCESHDRSYSYGNCFSKLKLNLE